MTSQTFSVIPIDGDSRQQRIGLMAALGTVTIWSLYFMSLKVGALSALSSIDLALLRFAIPALLLLSIFLRSWSLYKKTPWVYKLGIVFGGGLPFFMASAGAMKASGVLFGSTLIPGVAPLFVTLIAITLFKQPLPKKRLVGLIAIGFGTIALLAGAWIQGNGQVFRGALMFVGCAFSWSLFTISVRQSNLRPLQIAALAAVPNGVLITLYLLAFQPNLTLLSIPFNELLAQALVQGVLVGICSGLFYSIAIGRLGAEKTAAIGSLTPIVSTLLAVIILQEALELIPVLGLCLVATGVILASRVQST